MCTFPNACAHIHERAHSSTCVRTCRMTCAGTYAHVHVRAHVSKRVRTTLHSCVHIHTRAELWAPTCLRKISDANTRALISKHKSLRMHVHEKAQGAVGMRRYNSECALIRVHVNSSTYKHRYFTPALVAGRCMFRE